MSDNKSAQIIPLESRSAASQKTNSGAAQGVDDLYQGVLAGLPNKPRGLKKKESELWDEMGQKLADLGILSEIDLSVFHRYVISYIEWQHWNTECQKERGMKSIQVFATGARQMSVEAVLRKQAAELLAKLEQQLGMTPRARQAIKLENPNQGSLDL
jgi:P27 family predicted phage terminase small subunit